MTQPTVVFIDDSATMREVIKIAFRRENIGVVAFPDANSALLHLDREPPDLVISDVIMPDRDGYEVCQAIKQHPRLCHTPVILMSGVVNRAVAEKAFSVKADELIRKPFQPQDLITRVKQLLNGNAAAAAPQPVAAPATAVAALSSIFAAPQARKPNGVIPMPSPAQPFSAPAAAAAAAAHVSAPFTFPPAQPSAPAALPQPAPGLPPMPQRPVVGSPGGIGASTDAAKLKLEMMRLEGLVKKLQSELAAEREYSIALEAHIKTLQESK